MENMINLDGFLIFITFIMFLAAGSGDLSWLWPKKDEPYGINEEEGYYV